MNKITLNTPFSGMIRCPNCGECLTPADLEAFAMCPFCDWKFPRDAKFEDFVIEPVVNHWMARSHKCFPGE
ncbi:MAG: hypothetical protein LBM70_00280 [Victivallales bacterium]|jgi:uncharacterized CHY-type Zn-finger protein|nr:hypothetical protein [Victivallales bacterium]